MFVVDAVVHLAALWQGVADGTIDAVVSDHTPVDEDAKTLPFAEAEPGATGLELLLPLSLKWGRDNGLGLGNGSVVHGSVAVTGGVLGGVSLRRLYPDQASLANGLVPTVTAHLNMAKSLK